MKKGTIKEDKKYIQYCTSIYYITIQNIKGDNLPYHMSLH